MTTESTPNSQELLDILNELISGSSAQLGPLGVLVDGLDKSDLTPDVSRKITQAKRLLQRYQQELARIPVEDAIEMPQESHSKPSVLKPDQATSSAPREKQKRRKRDKVFDLLPLEALIQRAPGRVISQKDIQKLFEAFDPETKGKLGSLIAKVSRYRNEKDWMSWTDPDDLHITDAGLVERERLLAILRSQGRLPEVEAAFKKGWDMDVVLS